MSIGRVGAGLWVGRSDAAPETPTVPPGMSVSVILFYVDCARVADAESVERDRARGVELVCVGRTRSNHEETTTFFCSTRRAANRYAPNFLTNHSIQLSAACCHWKPCACPLCCASACARATARLWFSNSRFLFSG